MESSHCQNADIVHVGHELPGKMQIFRCVSTVNLSAINQLKFSYFECMYTPSSHIFQPSDPFTWQYTFLRLL